MKEVILITGANGLIAKHLAIILTPIFELRFLTRSVKNEGEYLWDLSRNYIDISSLNNVDHIIHLAGSNIASSRWSNKRKRQIISSRIDSAKLILETLQNSNINITSFITSSAIGFYGTDTTENIYEEDDKSGSDFLSEVCRDWENIADEFQRRSVAKRVVKLRTGIVLSKDGGVLQKMMPPIKYYIGSPLGTGNQYMPWIHVDDLCLIYKFAIINNRIQGSYNAVAPDHVTNKQFTKLLMNIFKRTQILPNVPPFIIKLLFGEVSTLLLHGSRISNKKIIDEGFEFQHPKLEAALKNLCGK